MKKDRFLVACALTAFALVGCRSDEQSSGDGSFSVSVHGSKIIFGADQHVSAWYDVDDPIAAGADEKYLTSDDLVTRYTASTGNSDGMQRDTTVVDPGPDRKWFTDDDHISQVVATETSSVDQSTVGRSFGSPGPDGRWMTDDDIITGCSVTTAESVGNGRTRYLSSS